MRYLISSILFVLCFSCVSYPKKKGFTETSAEQKTSTNPYFSNPAKDYIYKANIEAFENSFSGILVIKKIATAHHRIVFTTEMGNKIFDFTFQGETFKVNHILKKMDKKILINILKNDLRLLITEDITVAKTYKGEQFQTVYETRIRGKKYFYFKNNGELFKIIKTKKGKEKKAYLFVEKNDDFATQIEIVTKNERLRILLKSI